MGDRAEFLRAVRDGAAALGIVVGEWAAERMFEHLTLVREFNEACGLTSVVGTRDAAVKHYVDCLSVLMLLTGRGVRRIADVGSGAGYPGVVICIQMGWVKGKAVEESGSVALIEASEKKAGFLRNCVETLGLRALVVGERAETVGRGTLRESLDVAVCRAVGPLPSVLEVSSPLVRVGGMVVAMRGPRGREEGEKAARVAERLGLGCTKLIQLELPWGYGNRVLVGFEKLKGTPGEYPRRDGVPFKRPLMESGV